MLNVGEFDKLTSTPSPAKRFCQSKVEYLHFAIGCDFDVPRFQVAVDDAPFVSGFQGFRNLKGEFQGLFNRNRTALQLVGECIAFDEFPERGTECPCVLQTRRLRRCWDDSEKREV